MTTTELPSRPRESGSVMPSSVNDDVSVFDKFAGACSKMVSRAPFFAFCVLLVVLWTPSILLLHDVDTWQLIINTATTIITFLMVAVLQNSETRSEAAMQHKLNAIADGLADLMKHVAESGPNPAGIERDIRELRAAVGLEDRESSS